MTRSNRLKFPIAHLEIRVWVAFFTVYLEADSLVLKLVANVPAFI